LFEQEEMMKASICFCFFFFFVVAPSCKDRGLGFFFFFLCPLREWMSWREKCGKNVLSFFSFVLGSPCYLSFRVVFIVYKFLSFKQTQTLFFFQI
jgi:hypothetical protein